MTFAYGKNSVAVLPIYRRMCKFTILIHFLALTVLYKNNACTFSVLMLLRENEFLAHKLYMHRNCKRLIAGKSFQANADFIFNLGLYFSFVVFATWLSYFYIAVVMFTQSQDPCQRHRQAVAIVHPRVCPTLYLVL